MSSTFVYVGTYTNDPAEGIHRFRLDTDTGALTPAGIIRDVPNPFYLVVNAAGDRLYAANGVGELDGLQEGAVSAFAIEPGSDELTFLNRRPSRGRMPCYLDLHAGGGYVLAGNYGSGSVAVLPIEADGSLGEACDAHQHEGSSVDASRQEGPHVHSLVLGPGHRYAYAPDLGIDRVVIYAVDGASGRLTAAGHAATAPGAGPRHIAFHSNGRFAYLVNELNSTVDAFAYDAGSGALTSLQTLPMLPAGFDGESWAADLQILPSGDFLYASNRGHDTLAIYRIDADSGHLTPAGHAGSAGAWPWNLELDPTGRFLLAANQRGDRVSVLAVDAATGQLTDTGHGADVPKPVRVAVAPQVGG